jgi:predicted RNA-binding Zn ribbon-like protein
VANTAREAFVVGLRNAHATEVQARELMDPQSGRLGDYPDVQAKVKEHLAGASRPPRAWSFRWKATEGPRSHRLGASNCQRGSFLSIRELQRRNLRIESIGFSREQA